MADKSAPRAEPAPNKGAKLKIILAALGAVLALSLSAAGGYFAHKLSAPEQDEFSGLIAPAGARVEEHTEKAKAEDAAAEEDCTPLETGKEDEKGEKCEHGGGHGGGGHGEADKGEGGDHGKPPCGPKKKKIDVQPEFATSYYEFPGPFTANLRNSRHFVQVQIAVSTQYDDQVIANVKSHEPAIRGAIIATLSDCTDGDIIGVEAKTRLADKLRDAINVVLEKKTRFGGVEEVSFTSFVTQ